MKGISIIFSLVVILFGGGLLLLLGEENNNSATTEYDVRPYIEIENPSGFVNTNGEAISFAEYVGEKVILFDFMTYSCINCQRVFPYLNAWYETYQDDGLIVIGIHTPEFAFERDVQNVEEAMEEFGITFPVVLDNDYSTWRAYGNRFWPRKYLIDIHGNIVYDHIGEGAYEETEEKIIELLQERSQFLSLDAEVIRSSVSDTIEAFVHQTKSPETYIGTNRNEYLLNAPDDQRGLTTFRAPDDVQTGGFYLSGTWAMTGEYAESFSESVLTYKYTGQEVYLVAGSEEMVEVEVWQDGELVDAVAGEDVTNGIVEIQKNRLYKLIKNEEAGEHVLELRIKGSGAELYAFTFS